MDRLAATSAEQMAFALAFLIGFARKPSTRSSTPPNPVPTT
jgi:hypothetical protein